MVPAKLDDILALDTPFTEALPEGTMKKFFLIIFLLISATTSYAQSAFDNQENLSGLWSDINTEDFTNGYMIIAQDGDQIHVAHYVEWQGKPLVEYGSGTRQGDKITYDVSVTRGIPGWATEGTHTLVLSDDGNTLEGQYQTKEDRGPLKFERAGK